MLLGIFVVLAHHLRRRTIIDQSIWQIRIGKAARWETPPELRNNRRPICLCAELDSTLKPNVRRNLKKDFKGAVHARPADRDLTHRVGLAFYSLHLHEFADFLDTWLRYRITRYRPIIECCCGALRCLCGGSTNCKRQKAYQEDCAVVGHIKCYSATRANRCIHIRDASAARRLTAKSGELPCSQVAPPWAKV